MRISGITIPDNKRLEYALTAIYGIGLARARVILKEAKVEAGKKGPEVSADDENRIRKAVENYKIEGELKREQWNLFSLKVLTRLAQADNLEIQVKVKAMLKEGQTTEQLNAALKEMGLTERIPVEQLLNHAKSYQAKQDRELDKQTKILSHIQTNTPLITAIASAIAAYFAAHGH